MALRMLFRKAKELGQRLRKSRFRSYLLAASSAIASPWAADKAYAQLGGIGQGAYPTVPGTYVPPVSAPGMGYGQPYSGQPYSGQPYSGQPVVNPPITPIPNPYPPIPSVSPTPPPSMYGETIASDPPAWPLDPALFPEQQARPYQPRVRDVPVDVYLQEGQTGRFMVGGSVNSDLGVMGNITIEERNFDLFRVPLPE